MREGPSRTAEAVCLVRAVEQRRAPAGRILDDPFAAAFLGATARAYGASLRTAGPLGRWLERRLDPGVLPYVLARHRFIDDALLGALSEGAGAGPVAQVLILGAGYDTRAWRFASELADRPVFEVDHPATSARKRRILARRPLRAAKSPDLRQVVVDFRTDSLAERLVAAGFESGLPTFVVWEGVSMYLPREAIEATLASLQALCGPGSQLAMDFWYLPDRPDAVGTVLRAGPQLLHLVGEPLVFGIHPDDVGAFLARSGWAVSDLATAAELEGRYVRDGRRVVPTIFALVADRS